MRRYGLTIALLTLALVAIAQEKPAPKSGAPGQKAASAGQGGLATKTMAEMERLHFMIGAWSTAEKFEPSDFVPQGGTGNGKAMVRASAGGRVLAEDYESKNSAVGPFAGHAVYWWDEKAGDYKSFWCDSFQGCEPNFASGNWQGDKLVFTGNSEMQGKKLAMRYTFSDLKPDAFTWSEEVSVDGGPMKPSATIHYRRVSGPKAATKPNPMK